MTVSALSKPRALVIGEALVDVVRTASGDLYEHPGGSPANVAVGLARLGEPTALLTRLGRDGQARLISEHLAANHVRLLATVDDAPTNRAEATVDGTGQADYDLRVCWQLPADALAGADTTALQCVHTGSIAATLSPGAQTTRELIAALRDVATVSYDPNCRPSQMGAPEDVRASIEAVVARADVVKASDADLEYLYPDVAPVVSARRWLAAGPALVVLTEGAVGYRAWTNGGAVSGPAVTVDVVDTVGAGDAFMSALLAGLAHRDLLGAAHRDALRDISAGQLRVVLHEAAMAAAITCSRPGANPPTEAELAAAFDWPA